LRGAFFRSDIEDSAFFFSRAHSVIRNCPYDFPALSQKTKNTSIGDDAKRGGAVAFCQAFKDDFWPSHGFMRASDKPRQPTPKNSLGEMSDDLMRGWTPSAHDGIRKCKGACMIWQRCKQWRFRERMDRTEMLEWMKQQRNTPLHDFHGCHTKIPQENPRIPIRNPADLKITFLPSDFSP
jgi:hypothetical protein